MIQLPVIDNLELSTKILLSAKRMTRQESESLKKQAAKITKFPKSINIPMEYLS